MTARCKFAEVRPAPLVSIFPLRRAWPPVDLQAVAVPASAVDAAVAVVVETLRLIGHGPRRQIQQQAVRPISDDELTEALVRLDARGEVWFMGKHYGWALK